MESKETKHLRSIKVILKGLLWIKRQFAIILVPIIFLIVWFAFFSFWKDLINKYWVVPIMSQINRLTAIVLFIIIAVLLLTYYATVFIFEKVLYKKRLFLSIFVAFVFLSCFWSNNWDYLSFKVFGLNIPYSIIAILFVILEIALLIRINAIKVKQNLLDENYSGLLYEKPLQSDKDNESFNRSNYAKTVADELSKSFNREGSFTIGISGEWGAGKTSFSNLIKNKMQEGENEIKIIFEFKPWFGKTSSEIVENFFKIYLQNITPYIPELSTKIPKYINALIEYSEHKLIKFFQKIFTIATEENVQSLYDEIKRKLEKCKIKVIIFIDDLDRLDKNEILEVLRILRNSANFPYTQFITTYDKDYLISAMTGNNIPKASQYLQKIFNLEISLPKYEERILCEELSAHLKVLLKEFSSKIDFDHISDTISYSRINEDSEDTSYIIPKILPTVRDIIRYTNSLKLNLAPFKSTINEIDVFDFCILELIRYGFPEIYTILRDNLLEVLSYDLIHRNYFYPQKNKLEEKESHFKLADYMASENSKKENIANEFLIMLFDLRRTANNNSINNLTSYIKYFAYRLDKDSISISEFLNVLNTDDPLPRLEKWHSEKKSGEIRDKLSQSLGYIKNNVIPHKEIYILLRKALLTQNEALKNDTMLVIILHLNKFQVYSYTQFLDLISLWLFFLSVDPKDSTSFDNSQFLISFMYLDNLNLKIRRFQDQFRKPNIIGLLQKARSPIKVTQLLYEFIQTHQKSVISDSNLVLSIEDIKEIQLSYLKNNLAQKTEINDSDMVLLQYCVDSIDPNPRIINLRNEALALIFEQIKSFPQGYIQSFPRLLMASSSPEWNQIGPEPFWKQIFGSTDKFEDFINDSQKDNLEGIRKVRNFWQLYKNNDYKPIEFNRQGKVQDKIDSDFIGEIKELEVLLKIKEELISIDDEVNSKDKENLKISLDELELARDQVGLYISLNGEIQHRLEKLKEKLNLDNNSKPGFQKAN
jgi:hypothetical protein